MSDSDEGRSFDDHSGLYIGWVHTITNVMADSKGQIRRGGFVPGALYKIISLAKPPEGVSTISIKGIGAVKTEEAEES